VEARFRLLGFFDGPRLVGLVSGFSRKAAEVARQKLALAEKRTCDYLSRKGADERRGAIQPRPATRDTAGCSRALRGMWQWVGAG
jgi:hypothetical protein